jgi:hypothetical protein
MLNKGGYKNGSTQEKNFYGKKKQEAFKRLENERAHTCKML